MLKGVADYIEQDALEGYEALGTPMAVIDTLLMPAMERVGTLFGEGKMFLPQVVKTARVMKRAVAALTPYIEQGGAQTPHNAGKVLIATVKGDVHEHRQEYRGSRDGLQRIRDKGPRRDGRVAADRRRGRSVGRRTASA